MFVVRSTGLSQDGQRCSWKSSSCGEKIVYQWDCLSFPPQISLCWCSDLHLKATPENWKLCFHSDLATAFELCALSVTKAVKCTGTECHWRPIDKLRHYAPHWFWFGNRTFLFSWFSVLYQPLRHGVKIVSWTAMTTRKHRKTHDVDHSEKMIPFITSEMAFRPHVCDMVLGIYVFDLDFWVQATLWVRDTCLIVGHQSLMITLMSAAFS